MKSLRQEPLSRRDLPWCPRTLWAAARGRWNYLTRDMPESIAVEISTMCNRRCTHCPQYVHPLPRQVISEELWLLVLARLTEARLGSFVLLNAYNELTLVPNSERYVRDLVRLGYTPKIFTNGDFPDAIERWLDAGARQILVTRHDPEPPQWRSRLERVLQSPYVGLRENEMLDNRAGWIPDPDGWVPQTSCFFPNHMCIRVDGKVTLCLLDYDSSYPIADIRTQTIAQIWRGEYYRSARRMTACGRPAMALCQHCFQPHSA